MTNAVWKLTTLAGVVGIGLLVVMNAQRGLDKDQKNPLASATPDGKPEEKGADKGTPDSSDPRFGPDDFQEADPVPASIKNGGTSRTLPEQDEPIEDLPVRDDGKGRDVKRELADGSARRNVIQDQQEPLDPVSLGSPDEPTSRVLPREESVKRQPALEPSPAIEPDDADRDLPDNAERAKPAPLKSKPAAEPVAEEDPDDAFPIPTRTQPADAEPESSPAANLDDNHKAPRDLNSPGEELGPQPRDEPRVEPKKNRDENPPSESDDDSGFGGGRNDRPAQTKPQDPPGTADRRPGDVKDRPNPTDDPVVKNEEIDRGPERSKPAELDEPIAEPLGNPQRQPVPLSTMNDEPSNADDDDVIPTRNAGPAPRTEREPEELDNAPRRQEIPARDEPPAVADDDTIRVNERGTPPAGPPSTIADEPPAADRVQSGPPRDSGPTPASQEGPRGRPRSIEFVDEVDFVQGPRSGNGAKIDITKVAPQTALLGEPLIYSILVRNSGSAKAAQVIVEDHIPDGMELEGTIPQAELHESRLVWKLGQLDAGEQRTIKVKVTPHREGKIGTVAMVRFASSGPAETVVGAPRLRLELTGPGQVMLGSPAAFRFKVTNTGPMEARKVVIRSKLPPEFHFPDGDLLTYEVGTLPAGKSDEVSLKLIAAKQGPAVLHATVTSDGGGTVQAEARLEILGANFKLTRTGPKRLYMGKTGTWENQIFNKDPRPVTNLTIEERVPVGMRFIEASRGGRFDSDKRVITWNLSRVEPGETVAVSSTLALTGRGSQTTSLKAFDSTAMAMLDFVTNGQGVSGLSIDISDIETPQVVGDRFTVKVRVANRGSDVAKNVRTAIVIPPNLEFVGAKGRSDFQQVKNQLEFDPTSVDSQQESTVDLTFRARVAGETRLQVLVGSDRYTEPLRAEAATTVVGTDE